ncbi:MAG: MFS transporter [Pseudomonadota bacterium]|nr:MFS transporter [Pseudomonadota bacterium]
MMAFAVLIGGQLLSFIGTTLTAMAVGIWVFEETGSLVSFAWLLILTLVPAILILPFGGLIADRLPRKPAMIVVECLSVSTSAAVLALMASGRLEIWHLFVHAALNGVALGLQRPLYESTTPLMVPKERLGSVNGIVHSVAGLGQVLAPVMAGTLVFTIGLERVLMLDLATFLFALACLLAVRVPNPPREEKAAEENSGRAFFEDVAKGWRFVTQRPGLLALFAFVTLRNFFFATCEVVVMPLLLVVTTPEKAGAVLSAGGLGVIAGGLAMGYLGRSRRLVTWIIAAQGLTGIAMIVGGIVTDLTVIAVALSLAFLAFPIEEASSTTIMQRKVPAALLGRVSSVRNIMAMSAPPLAMIIAAPLAGEVFEPMMQENGSLAGSFGLFIGTGEGRGMALLLFLSGLLTLGLTILGFCSSRLRNLEAELPDYEAYHSGEDSRAGSLPEVFAPDLVTPQPMGTR